MNMRELLDAVPGVIAGNLDASPLFVRTSKGKAVPLHCPGDYVYSDRRFFDSFPETLQTALLNEDGASFSFMLYRGTLSMGGLKVVAVYLNGESIRPGELTEKGASCFFAGTESSATKRKFVNSYNSQVA
jgi:hypothetical protein